MSETKKLSSSLEDYLETILILEQEKRVARVKDISRKLSVKMPSVSGALKILKNLDLIEYEKNSPVYLTEEGLRTAKFVLRRHQIIFRFLKTCLGLKGEWVEKQACIMEHSINLETAARLEKLTEWIEKTAFNEKKISMEKWNSLMQQE